jgi:hypothetical protein
MAWTQTEVDQVRAAILALATGTRVVTVSYAGPPARAVTYGAADLAALRALLEDMEYEVTGPPAKTYRLATTRKGV